MDAQFIAMVQKLIAEQGKDVLNNTALFKLFLEDYTGMDYQKERRLFVQALEAGAAKAIDRAGDLETCKKQQLRILQEDHFLDPHIAADLVDTLALALRGEDPPLSQNMVRIQGGTFLMGSPSSEPDREANEVQHEMQVSSFSMGKYEVTQQEWKEVIGNNPSHFKGDNLPVECVRWYDAIEYCNKRSEREGLTPAYRIDKSRRDQNNRCKYDNMRWVVSWNRSANGYRLPTEAEWEYACRAGTTTPFNTGNNITTDQANYNGNFPYNNNAKGEDRWKTTEVGSFPPNPWGLYDMHGNVYEWCWDWDGDYFTGVSWGSCRVIRGGSWKNHGQYLRSAYRCNNYPSSNGINLGFRVLRP